MGSVTSMAEFLQGRKDKVDKADPDFLRGEFEAAAMPLYKVDPVQLAAKVDRWDATSIPNISDSVGRGQFAYKHGERIARHIMRVCAPAKLEAVELETVRQISEMTKSIYDDIRGGTSHTIIRNDWDRAIGDLVNKLTTFTVPLLQRSNRSDAPDPRNA